MDDFSQQPINLSPDSEPSKKTSSGSSNWSSAMAIIIAILAIIAASFSWEAYQAVAIKNKAQDASDNSIHAAIENNIKALSAQLAITQQNVAQLMQNNASPQQQSINQIAALLNLANLQLIVTHDANAALQLLEQAQEKIAVLDDSRFFNLNKSILNSIQLIKTDASIDITTVLSALDTLSTAVSASNLMPTTQKLAQPEKQHPADATWYKSLIVVRHTDSSSSIAALLSVNEQALIKSLIQNKLMLAEYAAIHHNNAQYQEHLKMITQWIETYYINTSDKQKLIAQVQALQATDVSNHLLNINASITLLNQIIASNQPPQATSGTAS